MQYLNLHFGVGYRERMDPNALMEDWNKLRLTSVEEEVSIDEDQWKEQVKCWDVA